MSAAFPPPRTLPKGHPFGEFHSPGSGRLSLSEGFGDAAYAYLRGYVDAQPEPIAEALVAGFKDTLDYLTSEVRWAPWPELPDLTIPRDHLVLGDDGTFLGFSFLRYASTTEPPPLRNQRGYLRSSSNTVWQRTLWQGDEMRSYYWKFAYNGAMIYRGPRTPDAWAAWLAERRNPRDLWSTHT